MPIWTVIFKNRPMHNTYAVFLVFCNDTVLLYDLHQFFVYLQPLLGILVSGKYGFYPCPKRRAVVFVSDVAKLVNNNIIND